MHRLIVDVGDLSAVVDGPARPGGGRPGQPPAGPAVAAPARRRAGPRRGPGGERPADADGRRPERLPAAARRRDDASARSAASGRPSTGPDRYRRGLYTFFWRATPHPALTVFDAPDATRACTRRDALEHAAAGADAAERRGVRRVRPGAGRPASSRERPARRRRAGSPRPSASAWPGGRPTPSATRLARSSTESAPRRGRPERDAWTTVARVLLNLDEFITRE